MPTYGRECIKCGLEFDQVCFIAERDNSWPCPSCGSVTMRVFGGANIEVFKPTVFEHMGDKPVFVTSKRQLREECKRRDLVSHYLEGTPKGVVRRKYRRKERYHVPIGVR